MNRIIAETPGVAGWLTVGGNSVLDGATASNAATFYVVLKPWEERTDASLSQDAILADLRRRFAEIEDAISFAFPPPAIAGVGVAGGFQMQVQDRGGAGLAALGAMAAEMVRDGEAQSGLASLNSSFRAGVPQLYADIDREKVKALGIQLSDVFDTLQTFLGSAYVNDFNLFGRTYQVRVQAEPAFRRSPGDVRNLDVRNAKGEMVPLGTVVDVQDAIGPQIVLRYNLYPAAMITGEASLGYSSGQALLLMEEMARAKLTPAMGFEWTGISYQEKQVGSQASLVFALAVLLVFLVLAALYESWSSPAAVIMVVPLALLGR